jgi:hypothetical protein
MSTHRRASRAFTVSLETLTEIVEKRQAWFTLLEHEACIPTASRASAMASHVLGLDALPSAPVVSSLVGERVCLTDPHPSTLRADCWILGAHLLTTESEKNPPCLLSIRLIGARDLKEQK